MINSPVKDYVPADGGTSGFTHAGKRPSSPILDNPVDDLEKELAGLGPAKW